jgi:RHS repeat-associated protein
VAGLEHRVAYTLNNVGSRTARGEALNGPLETDTYGHDATDQLTSVAYADGRQVAYQYDALGNRQSVNDAGTVTAYTANPANQYTAIGAFTPEYDSAGNATQLEPGLGCQYDSDNHLTSAERNGRRLLFYYDGRHRVIARRHMDSGRIEQLQYDGWNLIEERDENDALTKTHVHGPEVDEIVTTIRGQDPTPLYHHHDGLGSVIALTTTNATLLETYRYDVYGQRTVLDHCGCSSTDSIAGNRFAFTGREWLGEVGLYDYRHRVYSPTAGRFLQTDPIGFEGGDVNWYRYVGNQPDGLRDALGLAGGSGYGVPNAGNPDCNCRRQGYKRYASKSDCDYDGDRYRCLKDCMGDPLAMFGTALGVAAVSSSRWAGPGGIFVLAVACAAECAEMKCCKN